MAHIAGMSPDVTLALVAEVRCLRAALARCASSVELIAETMVRVDDVVPADVAAEARAALAAVDARGPEVDHG
jgi:hypothetical protein